MLTCHLRVVTRGALHEKVLIHPSDSLNPDTLATAAAKDGKLCHFDVDQTFLEASADEKIYIKRPEENQTFPAAVGLLNKISGLVQTERCWFDKYSDGRTAIGAEQAHPCVSRKVH